MRERTILAVFVGAALAAPVAAQHPVEHIDLMVRNLRDFGQPVIPIFEGWFPGKNGGYDVCFGYFNLNLKEEKTLPVGPDNFVRPERYDGGQPTHFDQVPPPPNDYRRLFCAFTVNVPDRTEELTWTLRWDGQEYTVPSNLGDLYQINELTQPSRNSFAPIVRFEPNGPEGEGRTGTLRAAALRGAVGRPVQLPAFTAKHPLGEEAPAVSVDGGGGGGATTWYARWGLHSGPGTVTFESRNSEPGGWLELPEGGTGTDRATFSAPGRYVLRLQVIDSAGEGGSFQFQCCWTNAYVDVEIAAR
jgi:hypothetical protein